MSIVSKNFSKSLNTAAAHSPVQTAIAARRFLARLAKRAEDLADALSYGLWVLVSHSLTEVSALNSIR